MSKNHIKVTNSAATSVTVKLKGTRTNDTLSARGTPVTIDPIVFPEPRYRAAIKTKDQADDEKLGKLLNDAKYEDPTILVDYSKELKQTIIQGQGEHHLNILRSRIASENKRQYDYIAPKIPYRETITKVAQADYRHKKQSGGAGQFGEVHLLIEPYTEGMPDPKLGGRTGGKHQGQGRVQPAVGRQAAIVYGDRRRRDRRPLHAGHPERHHGEDGRRSADGFLRPRHPRHRL